MYVSYCKTLSHKMLFVKKCYYELKFKFHKIFAIDIKCFSINCLHLQYYHVFKIQTCTTDILSIVT